MKINPPLPKDIFAIAERSLGRWALAMGLFVPLAIWPSFELVCWYFATTEQVFAWQRGAWAVGIGLVFGVYAKLVMLRLAQPYVVSNEELERQSQA